MNNDIKFLLDNGLQATLDENGFIDEITVASTGEKLQGGLGSFYSKDKSVIVHHYMSGISIEQNGMWIAKEGNEKVSIRDNETKTTISLLYRELEPSIDDLASISLDMDNGTGLDDGVDLTQGIFGTNVVSGNAIDVKQYDIEGENPEKCLQAIIESIKGATYIVSNPKITAKLGLIIEFAKDRVEKLVNAKYRQADAAINLLEQRKSKLNKQLEEVSKEIEQCDIAITQLKPAGKKI